METNTTILSPVQLVTIKNKIPLFKGEDVANAIEKIEIEENGFSLVAQKDLYKIGDKAIYIQPDFSLSDIPLFESFIRPFGDPKKSKLGSKYRIRAVKFNLHTGDDEPTYSVGILLPLEEVLVYVADTNKTPIDKLRNSVFDGELFTNTLGITKWEEPDNSEGGGQKSGGREYPSDMYKTDETNINNLWGHIEKKMGGYPLTLIGTEKTDGSSISLIFKDENTSVGSRKLIKSDKINKVVGYKRPNILQRIRMVFGYKPNLLITELVDNDDQFIQLAKPYIQKIKDYFINNNKTIPNIIFRGEANGQSWKGSGNKNNPSSKNEPNIKFFGIDDYYTVATKLPEEDFNNLITDIGLERCKVIFNKTFNSREEIEKECKEYFKTNMIEGIVLRSLDSKFSAKFMNDEYDMLK